jgi:exodeoxyribonuclease VII large subunit
MAADQERFTTQGKQIVPQKKQFSGPGSVFDLPYGPSPAAKPATKSPFSRSAPASADPDPVHSVSQVNALITQALADRFSGPLRVAGEISNFSVSQRGHAYFTLKDASAQLACVIWRDALARLGTAIRDGMAVVVRGSVRFYEPHGRIQLYVDEIFPQGAGALELAYRQLCEKLKGEGLFEQGRKRPIPRLPLRVAVITSPTGDALHDVLTTAHRRFPGLQVMVYPVAVQGPSAAGQIANAISQINRHSLAIGGVDLILLVRGGGSLEDLWAFNEEIVARAIVAGHIPIATGIGHEPDTTIADLVADLRGPTPTGVTELTVPDVRELLREIQTREDQLSGYVAARISDHKNALRAMAMGLTIQAGQLLQMRRRRLEFAARRVAAIEPRHAIAQNWRRLETAQHRLADHALAARTHAVGRLATLRQTLVGIGPQALISGGSLQLSHLEKSLAAGTANRLHLTAGQLEALRQRLLAISPQAVLERGFSITTDADGTIVRRAEQVHSGQPLLSRVAEGTICSTVK